MTSSNVDFWPLHKFTLQYETSKYEVKSFAVWLKSKHPRRMAFGFSLGISVWTQRKLYQNCQLFADKNIYHSMRIPNLCFHQIYQTTFQGNIQDGSKLDRTDQLTMF